MRCTMKIELNNNCLTNFAEPHPTKRHHYESGLKTVLKNVHIISDFLGIVTKYAHTNYGHKYRCLVYIVVFDSRISIVKTDCVQLELYIKLGFCQMVRILSRLHFYR